MQQRPDPIPVASFVSKQLSSRLDAQPSLLHWMQAIAKHPAPLSVIAPRFVLACLPAVHRPTAQPRHSFLHDYHTRAAQPAHSFLDVRGFL